MRRILRVTGSLAALVVLAGLGFAAFAWRSAIPAQEPPARAAFDQASIDRGARLAAVGNCIACHTVPGRGAFAGGLALATPFGTIHSTNITPDPETGIGRWSLAAFQRSMHEGVDREGNHLYPAFPYDHYTLVTAEDNRALYAYLMTREPVRAATPPPELPFPYNVRMLLAGWKLLFFEAGAFRPDARQTAEMNRGAYLAEGLAHCGGCHTPRNALGALERDRHWAGGEAEGWQSYAINEESPAPVPWDRESMAFYLRQGWHELHGVSRGPMAEVTGNLAGLPESDIQAIAAYTVSRMGQPTPERRRLAERRMAEVGRAGGTVIPAAADSQGVVTPDGPAGSGAAIYAAACASCHAAVRPLPYGGLHFALSTAVNAPSPQNIVNVTLFGLPPKDGEASSVMPGFSGALSDRQLAEVLAFMRERFSGQPPWTGLEELVRATRSGDYPVTVRPADGIERSPGNVGAEDRG